MMKGPTLNHLTFDTEKLTLTLMGDEHIGSKFYDEDFHKYVLDWCLENNSPIILMGDELECATRDSIGAGVYEQEEIIDKQIEHFYDIYKPLAEKGLILGQHIGNHEARVWKSSGVNLTKMMCRELGHKYLDIGKSHYIKVGNQGYTLYTSHGSSGARMPHTKIQAALRMSDMIDVEIYACLSMDTEILTKKGWKKYEEIKEGDIIPSLNLYSEILEWDKVKKVVENDKDNFINVKTKNVDMELTENHDVVFHNLSLGLEKTKAIDCLKKRNMKIPVAGNMFFKGLGISNELSELIGWIISEGSFCQRKEKDIYGIRIFQRKSNSNQIRDLLNKLKINFTESERNDKGRKSIRGKTYETKENIIVFYLPKEETLPLLKYFNGKNFSKESMDKMNQEEFYHCLLGLCKGDGCIRHNKGMTYYTGDKNLANNVQTMCVLRGWRCNLSERRNKSFDLGIHFSKFINVNGGIQQSAKKINKKAPSWCIQTNNTTLIARRNGKTFITGNSGHVHQLSHHMRNFYDIDKRTRTVKEKQKHFIITGSYLSHWGTYAHAKNYEPSRKGSPKVKLSGLEHRIRVSI
jgi:hypothetical protein